MRPYPGNQAAIDEEKKIFNYRLNCARRVSAFGILTKRFRIYERRLSMSSEHAKILVSATCCLHNLQINSSTYWPQDESKDRRNGLRDLPLIGSNATQIALATRENVRRYFISNIGSLLWQQNVQIGFHHIQ